MSFITKILGGSIGKVVESVGGVVDKFHLSGEEKQKFKLEMETLLQRRDAEIEETIRTELEAKKQVLVAELTQGDSYTKRARPTVVYAGLVFILFNYCIVPTIQSFSNVPVEAFKLPTEFWYGWTGIVGTWAIGRSVEKRGGSNRVTNMITGSGSSKLFDDAIG
ncbi:hypothetical protein CEE37_08545 [candidate division LCP-89 bacterium B3_LCP]|uniref:Holin of 3TMs, for gene-transfer release n=1 Tax=candidate division LCP-89 bacterium B3_LCP TaxID=2012998 RepID=A0A532UZI8_UNCL8|nr:MAG: hypothetical protein CEE37_08545 [candidate division LCP-89 bacterium B3_LCP]